MASRSCPSPAGHVTDGVPGRGPHARPVITRPGARLLHVATGRRRARRHCPARPVLCGIAIQCGGERHWRAAEPHRAEADAARRWDRGGRDRIPHRATPVYDLYTTPAFARQVLPHTAQFPSYFVRLREGADDIARFKSDVGMTGIGGTEELDTHAELVASSIHPQAVGWWLLAVLTALAGLAMVGQAIGRQSRVEGEGYDTLRVLAVTPGQLVGVGMARHLRGRCRRCGRSTPSRVRVVAGCASRRGTFCRDIDRSVDRPPCPSDGLLATIAAVLLVGAWPSIRQADAPRPQRQLRDRTIPVRQILASAACAPERGGRCPPCARPWAGALRMPVPTAATRHRPGHSRAEQHRRLRRQPDEPDGDTCAVRR